MKRAELIITSFLIVIILTGIPQTLQYFKFKTQNMPLSKISNSKQNESVKLLGKWQVKYSTEDFKGSVIYNLKKEDNKINGYTFKITDSNGQSMFDNKLTLIITPFKGKKGNAIYKIDYEEETYDVPCVIEIIDDQTFHLSYDYYGYSDVETWTLLNE